MKKNIILLSLLTLVSIPASQAGIWINEWMQSNIDCLRDDRQEFPDSWVELYNDSEQPVDIQNWYVSETDVYTQGWKINRPAIVPAKAYLLIYCDKESDGIHTSFRLDSGKGSVYLFNSKGEPEDRIVDFPKQPAPNIAGGRTEDGADTRAYFTEPTPGAQNRGNTSDTLLPNPVFSIKGGIYKSTVKLTLSLPENTPAGILSNQIHYTLDGSEPTAASPVYGGEISIGNPTAVKAKIIAGNYLTNHSKVESYIVTSRNLTLPVISLSLDPEYLWGDEFGIYTKGNGKYGTSGNGTDEKVNWNNEWRRPVQVEYFPDSEETSAINQTGEMRIAGGWSRLNPQKSLIVYANKRFGEKNYAYPFFKDKGEQNIKSFMIRNSGNDFWWTHFRDAAIQLFMGGKTDVDYQAYQPAILYVNGQYWGIENLRERSEEDFVLANHNLDNESIDVIENWWGEVKTGDNTAFNDLMNKLKKPEAQRPYDEIMNSVDIDEFINYMILEIFVANTDFPNNNVALWRPKTQEGKWRFILKDLDFGLGIWDNNPPSFNAIAHNIGNNDDTRLFKALLTRNTFKKKFYRRFAVYMGDILSHASTSRLINAMQSNLETEMNYHLSRWRDEMWWRDLNSWKNEVGKMKSWCGQRNGYVYTQLKNQFGLGTVMKMTLDASGVRNEGLLVSMNGVHLQQPAFDGSYFQKEELELRLEGDNSESYAWEITARVNNSTVTDIYRQKELTYPVADKCTKLDIKIIESATAIRTFSPAAVHVYRQGDQIAVSGLEEPSRISVYGINGQILKRINTFRETEFIGMNGKGMYIVHIVSDRFTVNRKVIID